jgi:hypothetical protein
MTGAWIYSRKVLLAAASGVLALAALSAAAQEAPVSPTPAAPAPAESTPAAIEPAPPADAVVPTPALEEAAPASTAPSEEGVARSIFFSSEQLNSIKQARKSYERRISGQPGEDEFKEDEFLKKLENLVTEAPDDQPFTYPQFFLSSILYRSQNDWAIWLNNIKITQDPETQKDIAVLAIDTQKVTLQWRPARMDKITDIGKSTDASGVKLDFINGKVEFTLRGNQTFSSYSMSVVEGRVPQMTLQPKNALATNPVAMPGAPAASPGMPAMPGGAPARPDRTGLGGLIGAYEAIGKPPNR